MNAAERLLTLARTTGAAGALLLTIGTGATASEALVDYSKLSTGTAEEHLLANADSGGDGLGKSKSGKPRRQGRMVYLEHEGKIVIFANAAQADAWLAAQKVVKKASRKTRISRDIPESAQVLDTTALRLEFQTFRPNEDLQRLLAQNQLRRVLEIHQRIEMQRDEDDIEMLLLAM